jgi:hypothetical protein
MFVRDVTCPASSVVTLLPSRTIFAVCQIMRGSPIEALNTAAAWKLSRAIFNVPVRPLLARALASHRATISSMLEAHRRCKARLSVRFWDAPIRSVAADMGRIQPDWWADIVGSARRFRRQHVAGIKAAMGRTLRQRYLPIVYLSLWLIYFASQFAIWHMRTNASPSYDLHSGHVVPYYVKGGAVDGRVYGFITPTEDIIDDWAITLRVLSLVLCLAGPVIAARAAWLEPRADKPPRLWD